MNATVADRVGEAYRTLRTHQDGTRSVTAEAVDAAMEYLSRLRRGRHCNHLWCMNHCDRAAPTEGEKNA